jgi:Bacterial TSP3 repeat
VIRSQRGQASSEYVGMLLLAAVVVAALISMGIGDKIAAAMNSSVCRIAGGACEVVGIGDDNPVVVSERASGRPLASDRDGDGVSNARERELGSDPENTDTDADGVTDGEEQRLGGDPTRQDSDDDGLPDADEAAAGLNLREGDTDKDGLTDAEELAAGTDPTEEDGDGAYGSPGDGLSDAREIELGTDPNEYDTDGDGYPDGHEVEEGDNPVDDERSTPQKLFEDVVLDDPIGAVLPGGAGAKGARKVVDGLLSSGGKTVRRIGGAKSIGEAAQIRRDRIKALRDRLRARKKEPDTPAPRPVAPAKRDTGKTVLGRYPRYVELSDEINARRFQIPDEVWKRMTPDEQWAANRRFLDRTIARGDEIILATPVKNVPATSAFAKELRYMRSKGYRVSKDGKKLLPPKP